MKCLQNLCLSYFVGQTLATFGKLSSQNNLNSDKSSVSINANTSTPCIHLRKSRKNYGMPKTLFWSGGCTGSRYLQWNWRFPMLSKANELANTTHNPINFVEPKCFFWTKLDLLDKYFFGPIFLTKNGLNQIDFDKMTGNEILEPTSFMVRNF